MHTDVLIVGGGLAGIACALALLDEPYRVLLVEADSALGGRARSWTDPVSGDIVDVGPHVIASEYRNFLALLDRLGTRRQIRWQVDPLLTLLSDGSTTDLHLHRLPAPLSLLPTMLRVRGVGWRAKLSNLGATLFALRFTESDVAALDALAGDELLRRLGVHPEFIDWFWRSLAMTLLNTPLESCSAAALMRCYTQLAGHSRYCFGFPRAGLADLFAPAATQRLTGSGSLWLGARLKSLLGCGTHCVGAILDDGTTIAARHVVCTLPPDEMAAVLPPRWRNATPFAAIGKYESSQYVSVYLWFRQRITQHLFWTRTWSTSTLNFDFYDLANIRGEPASRGSLIASNIIYSQRLPPMSDAQIIARTLQELAEFAPAAADIPPWHARVHRIPLAIPCPLPGSEMRRPQTTTSISGLLLAGDWTRTGLPACMESAVRSGFLAAEQILRSTGRARAVALSPPATTGFAALLRRFHTAHVPASVT
jgi:15-cis-phytoene desaturase